MKEQQAWPVEVCVAVERLTAVRDAEVVREKELVAHRKTVRAEFLALGPGESDAHRETALDLVRTMLHIDYCRGRKEYLADKIGDTIRNAHQPGLFGEEPLEEVSRQPSDEELFEALRKGKKKDDDQQEFEQDDHGPVGEAAPPVDEPVDESVEPEDDVEPDHREIIAGWVPGVFQDPNGREVPIGDLEALEEIINAKCGAVWHWRSSEHPDYGKCVGVSKEPGRSAPLVFTLRRVGDVPAKTTKKSSKKTSKKTAKKSSKKKTAKKKVGS